MTYVQAFIKRKNGGDSSIDEPQTKEGLISKNRKQLSTDKTEVFKKATRKEAADL